MSSNIKDSSIILISAILLITLSQVNNHMGVIALPTMRNYFVVNVPQIKFSSIISIFGFGFSQLVFGFLSDRIGRRKTAIIGLSIYVCSSFITAIACSFNLLILSRLLQGLGLGCVGAVASAMIRDKFSGEKLNHAFSLVSMAITITPFISFFGGGCLQQLYGWRASFFFMAIYGLILLLLFIVRITETNKNLLDTKKTFKKSMYQYVNIINNKTYLRYLMLLILLYSGEFAYFIQSPIIFQEYLNLSIIQNGIFMLITAFGMFLGATISTKLIPKIKIHQLISLGIFLVMLGSMMMLILVISHIFTVYTIVIPMGIFMIGSGIVFPNCIAGCMEQFIDNSGMAGALMSSLLMICSSILSCLVVYIPGQWLALPCFLLLISMLLWIVFKMKIKPATSTMNIPNFNHNGGI